MSSSLSFLFLYYCPYLAVSLGGTSTQQKLASLFPFHYVPSTTSSEMGHNVSAARCGLCALNYKMSASLAGFCRAKPCANNGTGCENNYGFSAVESESISYLLYEPQGPTQQHESRNRVCCSLRAKGQERLESDFIETDTHSSSFSSAHLRPRGDYVMHA